MVVVFRHLIHLHSNVTQITVTLAKILDLVFGCLFLGDYGHVIGVWDAEEAQI